MDQDDGHRNVERCWDHGKTGSDVKEMNSMAPPRRGIGDPAARVIWRSGERLELSLGQVTCLLHQLEK